MKKYLEYIDGQFFDIYGDWSSHLQSALHYTNQPQEKQLVDIHSIQSYRTQTEDEFT